MPTINKYFNAGKKYLKLLLGCK